MIGWIDASSGASGDMLLGALVDVGVPLEVIGEAVDAVTPEPIGLSTELVTRNGFAATRCVVDVADSSTHRTWRDIRALLDQASLDGRVREQATATFTRLAEAEAAVHGGSPDDVHFHEVGALDAIADVVGVCAGLAHLGVDELVVSPIAVGSGTVETQHGTLSVPPPAVARLLIGVPSYAGPVALEMCTPTGAALLTTHADGWGPQPAMTTQRIGTGAGGRDPERHANVLRLLVGPGTDTRGQGEAGLPASTAVVLEANVDDLDPRLWPPVLASLLDAGASDAWLTPILMKKGRPAHTLSVLVAADRADAVRREVFRQTTTIGLRETTVAKRALDRELRSVEVDGHRIDVKLATLEGEVLNAQPEYEHVADAAQATGRPIKDVLSVAVAKARDLLGPATS